MVKLFYSNEHLTLSVIKYALLLALLYPTNYLTFTFIVRILVKSSSIPILTGEKA